MPETKEQLLARLDELREVYAELDEKYYQLEARYSRKHPEVIKIVEELNKICDEAEKIELEIFERERTKGSNGTIFIRQSEIKFDDTFDICLCDTKEVIGDIGYQEEAYCPAIRSYCDNIAYHIYNPYHRGHGYAFQALCLFVNYLYSEKDIKQIQLFAHNNNIPSLKTIEKFNTLVNAVKIGKDEWETCYYFELNEMNMPLQIETNYHK